MSNLKTSLHRRRGPAAFTLVELLVVIGIIALLVSILLPTLARARRQANMVVCQSNLRQFLAGLQLYAVENNGYIPGPNTTGVAMHNGGPFGTFGGIAGSPVQDWDWMSPTVGRLIGLSTGTPKMNASQLETVRLQRYVEILETRLRCPDNETYYGKLYAGPVLPWNGPLHILSYVSPSFFHLMPAGSPTKFILEDSGSNGYYRLPQGYVPKISKVGQMSKKIFAFEGARYWNDQGPNLGYFDYTTSTASTSLSSTPQGNFHSRGPAVVSGAPGGASGEPYSFIGAVDINNPQLAKPALPYRQASLRHFGKMGAGFFDGHVEELTPGEAGRVEFWAPKGSLVGNGFAFARPAGFRQTLP